MKLADHLARDEELYGGGADLNLNSHWLSDTESRYVPSVFDATWDLELGIRAHDDLLMEGGVEGYPWSHLDEWAYALSEVTTGSTR